MNSARDVDPARLEQVRSAAGDGDVDERCRRILRAFREEWIGVPYEEPEPVSALMANRAAGGD